MNDVMSITKTGDSNMLDSLKTMFNEDENKIHQILSPNKNSSQSNSNVLSIEQKRANKKHLMDLFSD